MVLMICNFFFGGVFNVKVVEYYCWCVVVGVGLIVSEGIMVGYKVVNGYLNVLCFYGEDVLVGWK